jgi:hydroxymethylpyrimidine/phosphomethylpyrimidine kinase
MQGRVLIIAGSDPSGGAGVQADIKTVTALGGYAMAAITALTVQDTARVYSANPVPAGLVVGQAKAAFADIGADAIKIGMLGEKKTVLAVADFLSDRAVGVPVVLDPVLVATSGDRLAGEGVAAAILTELAPRCALLTPNTEELAALTGAVVDTVDAATQAARSLRRRTNAAVLAKGGHIAGERVVDILIDGAGVARFDNSRLAVSRPLHGAGCTLASAIATGLAQGLPLRAAVERAIAFVRAAIQGAQGFGKGALPLNHSSGSALALKRR